MKQKRSYIILILVFLLGLGLMLYPSVSDWWNSFHQSRMIIGYSEKVANMDEEQYDEVLSRAKEYNSRIAENGLKWTPLTKAEEEDYDSQLDIDGTGNMGFIDIPAIRLHLPVYHGTNENVLQKAIGHLEGTSLPVGGETSHCVLSGHRGLPSARIFSELDKVVAGDLFTITVLSETYTYEVDQIRIVEPTDLSDLQLVEGKDYCTLVTCTPYGINTHRLLVRGHRTDNKSADKVRVIADGVQIEPVYIAPIIAVPFLVLIIIWLIIDDRIWRRSRR